MSVPCEPFLGTAPAVVAGDLIEIRDAYGAWHGRHVAMAPPRYDQANAYRRCFLTVPVATVAEWRASGGDAVWVNWPAENVRAAEPEGTPNGQDR